MTCAQAVDEDLVSPVGKLVIPFSISVRSVATYRTIVTLLSTRRENGGHIFILAAKKRLSEMLVMWFRAGLLIKLLVSK